MKKQAKVPGSKMPKAGGQTKYARQSGRTNPKTDGGGGKGNAGGVGMGNSLHDLHRKMGC